MIAGAESLRGEIARDAVFEIFQRLSASSAMALSFLVICRLLMLFEGTTSQRRCNQIEEAPRGSGRVSAADRQRIRRRGGPRPVRRRCRQWRGRCATVEVCIASSGFLDLLPCSRARAVGEGIHQSRQAARVVPWRTVPTRGHDHHRRRAVHGKNRRYALRHPPSCCCPPCGSRRRMSSDMTKHGVGVVVDVKACEAMFDVLRLFHNGTVLRGI